MSFRNADSILFTFIKLLYTQVFDVAKFSISTQLQRALSKCGGGDLQRVKGYGWFVKSISHMAKYWVSLG